MGIGCSDGDSQHMLVVNFVDFVKSGFVEEIVRPVEGHILHEKEEHALPENGEG